MIFAQFYQKSVMSDDIIEACGDRAVIVLDGRSTLETNISLTRNECVKRGYLGFRLHRGETFNRSQAITSFQRI